MLEPFHCKIINNSASGLCERELRRDISMELLSSILVIFFCPKTKMLIGKFDAPEYYSNVSLSCNFKRLPLYELLKFCIHIYIHM